MTVSTASTATVVERRLTAPSSSGSQGFNDRKKRKRIDLDARVKRGRDGKLTYDEAQLGKRKSKKNGGSSASGKKRDASSEVRQGRARPAPKDQSDEASDTSITHARRAGMEISQLLPTFGPRTSSASRPLVPQNVEALFRLPAVS